MLILQVSENISAFYANISYEVHVPINCGKFWSNSLYYRPRR